MRRSKRTEQMMRKEMKRRISSRRRRNRLRKMMRMDMSRRIMSS